MKVSEDRFQEIVREEFDRMRLKSKTYANLHTLRSKFGSEVLLEELISLLEEKTLKEALEKIATNKAPLLTEQRGKRVQNIKE